MTAGVRYSLIVFFGRRCGSPAAEFDDAHALILLDEDELDELYPEGQYRCHGCGANATELGRRPSFCGMWHCAVGCEYDLCESCRSIKRCVRGWRKRHPARRRRAPLATGAQLVGLVRVQA
eukprot:3907579-Prymnesium_polylepis.1